MMEETQSIFVEGGDNGAGDYNALSEKDRQNLLSLSGEVLPTSDFSSCSKCQQKPIYFNTRRAKLYSFLISCTASHLRSVQYRRQDR
jgi:hypothetical protein